MPEIVEESNLFHVGYALPTRKIEAFMVPSFINYAKSRGIEFIPIDVSKPITEQGRFDCIIHKLYGDEWDLNLQNFSDNNPHATVIDHPSAIQRLHDRISMLEPVSQLNIPQLAIPTQLLVHDSESLKSFEATPDLNFPLIAKSVIADGSPNAHTMSLVLNYEGLTKLGLELEPPLVLQQFVNHGGIIFKTYIADDYVECVKRSSLPDVSPETLEKMAEECNGVMSFSKISAAVMACDDKLSDDNSDEKVLKMPTPEFLDEVAKGLRESLGLHLFNLDMIRDDKRDGFLVVDINYFPGYEKLASYETIMTDFFLNIKKSQEEKKMATKEVVPVDELDV